MPAQVVGSGPIQDFHLTSANLLMHVKDDDSSIDYWVLKGKIEIENTQSVLLAEF